MPAPNETSIFGSDVFVSGSAESALSVSAGLTDLLIRARSDYAWPTSQTAGRSQQRIIDLENDVAERIANLDDDGTHWIVQQVSLWGGSNDPAQRSINTSSPNQKATLSTLLRELLNPDLLEDALDQLSEQPGLGLVMATKIYRFCQPQMGAAVDRHCSYFFNSIEMKEPGGRGAACTNFRREWATGLHRTSRLAIYSRTGKAVNLREYVRVYLPRLKAIAAALNLLGLSFKCAASGAAKTWTPADVEMAAYQWWSRNGPR